MGLGAGLGSVPRFAQAAYRLCPWNYLGTVGSLYCYLCRKCVYDGMYWSPTGETGGTMSLTHPVRGSCFLADCATFRSEPAPSPQMPPDGAPPAPGKQLPVAALITQSSGGIHIWGDNLSRGLPGGPAKMVLPVNFPGNPVNGRSCTCKAPSFCAINDGGTWKGVGLVTLEVDSTPFRRLGVEVEHVPSRHTYQQARIQSRGPGGSRVYTIAFGGELYEVLMA